MGVRVCVRVCVCVFVVVCVCVCASLHYVRSSFLAQSSRGSPSGQRCQIIGDVVKMPKQNAKVDLAWQLVPVPRDHEAYWVEEPGGMLLWVWSDNWWIYNVKGECWERASNSPMSWVRWPIKWPDEKPKYYLQGRDRVRLLTLAKRVSTNTASIICDFLPCWIHHSGMRSTIGLFKLPGQVFDFGLEGSQSLRERYEYVWGPPLLVR